MCRPSRIAELPGFVVQIVHDFHVIGHEAERDDDHIRDLAARAEFAQVGT